MNMTGADRSSELATPGSVAPSPVWRVRSRVSVEARVGDAAAAENISALPAQARNIHCSLDPHIRLEDHTAPDRVRS